MIRVLIADDHQLMRQGLCALLAKAQDIEIIGEARDGQEAIEMARSSRPDVILMDIEMPHLNGLQATQELARSDFAGRTVILSMRSDQASVQESKASGAVGYLVKTISRDDLIAAIRSVYRGHRVASPAVEAIFIGDS